MGRVSYSDQYGMSCVEVDRRLSLRIQYAYTNAYFS
jgi:hypothetical protein